MIVKTEMEVGLPLATSLVIHIKHSLTYELEYDTENQGDQ